MKDHITYDLQGKASKLASTAIEFGTPYERHERDILTGMQAVFDLFNDNKLFDGTDIQRAYNSGKMNILAIRDEGDIAFVGSYDYLNTIKSDI